LYGTILSLLPHGQSYNEVWLEQRKGILTASILQEVRNKMEDIVKHKITKPTPLVAKVLGKSQSIDHVPAIKKKKSPASTTDFGQLVLVDLDVGKPVARTAFGFTLCREEYKLEISASETDLWSSLLNGRYCKT
jgi:hypothetical protein